jgi:transposase
MRSLDVPTVTSNLDCLERIKAQVEEMNQQLLVEFKRRPNAQLIATTPGIGYHGALLIHAEIDDINRSRTRRDSRHMQGSCRPWASWLPPFTTVASARKGPHI